MSRKAHTQKNTLLKAAEANAETKAFKRVFFSPAQKEIQIIFFPTLRFFYFFFQRTVRNLTVWASNVNRFEQSVCGLRTEPLRMNSMPAANKKLSENFKKGGLGG